MLTKSDYDKLVQDIGKELIDRGLLIAAGFAAFHKLVIPADASPEQVNDMRMCFFAGAQHLFATVMNVLDDDIEPTDNDLRRMSQIAAELEKFGVEFTAKLPTKGNA